MTVQQLILHGQKLIPLHQVHMLLCHVLKLDYTKLLSDINLEVLPKQVEVYNKLLNRIVDGEPIQYVIGNVDFYGYNYKVNKNVLIPRFETEELVNNTIKYIDKLFEKESLNVIDLGCGSGCIGITLKKERPQLNVTCLDISKEALEVAKNNSNALKADVTFIQGNMLNNISGKYDIIISNPPYISYNETIEDIVKNNEPHLALYASNDGLYYYDDILSNAKKNLNDIFLIALEIGMNQKEQIIELANKYFENVNIECKQDLSGKDRMIFIYNVIE